MENNGQIINQTYIYLLSIFLFHEMNITILQKICAKVFPQSALIQLAEYLLIPCFIILCYVLLSMFLQKYLPKVYSLITGNR